MKWIFLENIFGGEFLENIMGGNFLENISEFTYVLSGRCIDFLEKDMKIGRARLYKSRTLPIIPLFQSYGLNI